MNKDKWLIALDLDGTAIVDSNMNKVELDEKGRRINHVHPLTYKAIERMQELGHYVVINTGRNFHLAEPAYEALGLKSYLLLSAGARIFNPSTGEDEEHKISKELLIQILNEDFIKDNIVHIILEDKNGVSLIELKDTRKDVFEKLEKIWDVKYLENMEIFESSGCRVTLDLDYDEVQEIKSKLEEKYSKQIDFTNWQGSAHCGIFGITFNNAEWSKGKSLIHLANKLNIPPNNTMAFGDDENDLTMFKEAGVSVSMLNAKDSIKKFANHVTTKSNNDGGVGEFLNDWFNLNIE